MHLKKRKNNTDGGIRKEEHVRDGTIINLIEIATLNLASLVHIDNDGKSLLALQGLKIVQRSFQFVRHRSILFDGDISIVMSGFNHAKAEITLDD